MRNDNYPSASEIARNLAQIRVKHEVVHTDGRFRIVQFALPYFDGWEFWVVNEKGFLWEACDRLDQAMAYLQTEEALTYNSDTDF